MEHQPRTTVVYDLRVFVDRIEGRSVCGLKEGDYFELKHSSRLTVPPDGHFCIWALQAVLPFLAAKQRDIKDGDWLAGDIEVSCPDAAERVIMRIERLSEQQIPTDELI